MPDTNLLKDFSIFSGIDENQLASIAQCCRLIDFETNDLIFKEDEPAENLYGVLSGEVELTLTFQYKVLKSAIESSTNKGVMDRLLIEKKPITVDTIGPGDIFSWSALLTSGHQTAAARCTKPTQVFSISSADLKAMFDKDALLGYMIISRLYEVVSQRLRNRTHKLVEILGETFVMNSL
ncbi:MAG: cyclic nucleotide-binding domain-containing protein [Desulfobacterales bacterium]|nr:cyclic nucleotide-binding domain-containing protein [Desulfobacterales bacterium]